MFRFIIYPIILIMLVFIYWILVCISFFKKRKLKNFLFNIKKTNKKVTFAMSFVCFLIPICFLLWKLYLFIQDVQIYNKMCKVAYKVGQDSLDIERHIVKSNFISLIFLGTIILVCLIMYYIHNFSGHKIYENGISNLIFTITWDEIIECMVREDCIFVKCNYRLVFFNKMIIHTIKSKDNSKLISVLKKYNVNLRELSVAR